MIYFNKNLDFFDIFVYNVNMAKKRTEYNENFYFDRARNVKGNKSSSHFHDRLEIYYMKEGSCNYFIEDRSVSVKSGDLVFIPSGVIHKTNYGVASHERWLINCTEEYIPSSLRSEIVTMPRYIKRSKITDECEKLMIKIGEEYNKGDEFSVDALKSYVSVLLFILFRNSEKQEVTLASSKLIESAVKFINNNFGGEVSLYQTAENLGVSPEHLSRTFKKQTGFGFSEYLSLIRLQKAKNMLSNEPGKSVGEVAFTCGFNDSNYFSYKFKKTYGIPPHTVKKSKK